QADADDAVHVKESTVDPREVVGSEQAVLVDEQNRHGSDARDVDPSEVEDHRQQRKQRDHRQMTTKGHAEGLTNAQSGGNAGQASLAIALDVLTGIQDV